MQTEALAKGIRRESGQEAHQRGINTAVQRLVPGYVSVIA